MPSLESAQEATGDRTDVAESAETEDGETSQEKQGQINEERTLSAPDGAVDAKAGALTASSSAGAAPSELDRVSADLPLEQGEPAAKAGTVVVDGVKYQVDLGGTTATVIGWGGVAAPSGDVTVAAKVVSGSDQYLVTALAAAAFEGCDSIRSIALPASVESIGERAFAGCAALEQISVDAGNPTFASYEGMLFDAALHTLLACPAGKQGAANLPASLGALGAGAFEGCTKLSAVHAADGCAAYRSVDGVLYSADRSVAVYAPALLEAAVIDPGAKRVAAGAFADCASLSSVVSLGDVEEIESGAFSDTALQNAVVALAAGEDYEARRAIWEAAGFRSFADPARPGDMIEPAGVTDEQEASGFAFQLLDDYTLAVSWRGEADPDPNLAVPASAELDGVVYRVSAIAADGFAGRTALTSVTVPASVTSIGRGAFEGCGALSSASLAEGVQAIGARAFANTALPSVSLPSSVASVGAQAFAGCGALDRVLALADSGDVAGDALAGCSGVSVYLPYREDGAYSWSVGVPAEGNHLMPYGLVLSADPLSLETGQTADLFEGGVCEVPEGCELSYAYAATPLSVEGGTVTGKKAGTSEVAAVIALEGTELARASRTVEVTQPTVARSMIRSSANGGVTAASIGETFTLPTPEKKGQLTYTVLTEQGGVGTVSVTMDGNDVPPYGSSCTIPQTVENNGIAYTVTELGDNAFNPDAWSWAVTTSMTVTIPSTVTRIGDSAFKGCGNLSVAIPSSVTYVGSHAFDNGGQLASVDLAQFSHVGDYAFANNAASLASVSVPASLPAEFGSYVFSGCKKIGSAALVQGLTEIPTGLFQNCWGLTNLAIPSTVTKIGDYAFDNCTGLTGTLSIPSGTTYIGEGAFKSCSNLAGTISLPAALTRLGANAFSYCKKLTGAPVVPSGITELEKGVFSNCEQLTGIALPDGLVSIGAYAFDQCLKMRIDGSAIPSTVTSIGECAFCSTLLSGILVIPHGVTELPFQAFRGCAISGVVIPDSVTSIGTYAFADCVWLENPVVIPDSVTFSAYEDGYGMFADCKRLPSVTLGAGITELPDYFFQCCDSLTDVYAKVPVTNIPAGAVDQVDMAAKDRYIHLEGGGELAPWTDLGFKAYVEPPEPADYWTVTFDSMGGSAVASQKVSKGGYATEPAPAPTKPGYIFQHWSRYSAADTITIPWSFTGSKIASDRTLYAYWKACDPSVTYTVMFDSRGGSPVDPQTVAEGATVQKPANPTRDGQTFRGWYTDAACSNAYDFSAPALADIKLYAKWDNLPAASYTVAFETHGGSSVDSQTVTENDTATAPSPDPAREGYAFAGWYAGEDYAAKYDFSSPVTGDITLHAKWTLVIKGTVPAVAVVQIDATGISTGARHRFASTSAAPIKVSAVSSVQGAGADQVFADQATLSGVRITLAPADGSPVQVPLTGSVDSLTGFDIPANGMLLVDFGLVLPQSARVNYQADAKDVARLTYTIEAA